MGCREMIESDYKILTNLTSHTLAQQEEFNENEKKDMNIEFNEIEKKVVMLLFLKQGFSHRSSQKNIFQKLQNKLKNKNLKLKN